MLNLQTLVREFGTEEYAFIESKLSAGKATKFHQLLTFYRSGKSSEAAIHLQMGLNQNAFYVLKSRLYQKLQGLVIDFLNQQAKSRLNQSMLIPELVFDMPTNKAFSILTKLEKDYLELDLPHELTSIYSTLRRLHVHTEKYYYYDQLYNKHVAYGLALDKVEDLLARFMNNVANYRASRNTEYIEHLSILKDEINNHNNLYDSHHLRVYKNITDTTSTMFLPPKGHSLNDQPVEDLLREIEEIIERYPKDLQYSYLRRMIPMHWFEYYLKIGITKKAGQFIDQVNENLPNLMRYSGFGFCSHTLLSKLKFYQLMGWQKRLVEENDPVTALLPVIDDVPNYCNWVKYMTAKDWLTGRVNEANQHCQNLINAVSFKNYPHYEIEIKLLQVMCYIRTSRLELAWNLLRAISRKIRPLNKDKSYENVVSLVKVLKIIINNNDGDIENSLISNFEHFDRLNKGPKSVLSFFVWNDKMAKTLLQFPQLETSTKS